MRRTHIHWLAAIAGVALAVSTTCGTSGASTTSPAQAATGQLTASVSSTVHGTPIVLGAEGSYTGAGSGSTATAQNVLQAWVSYTNANGGINGHPVKMYSIDDGNDPATSLAGVKQLVQQDHVVAIFDISDDLDSTWATYLQSEGGIPVLGNAPSPVYLTNPNYYSTGSTILTLEYAQLAAAKGAGVKKLGVVYCAEIATCALTVPLIQQYGASLGISLVYSAKISSTAPDYTAPCLAAKAAGATGMTVTAASTTVVNVANSCYSQGYKPIYVTTAGEMTTSWLSIPAFNGAVGMVQDVPWFDKSLPATKTMQKAIAKYAPSVLKNPDYGQIGIIPWVTGAVFAEIAKTGNIGPSSTSADIVKALATVKNNTFGGLTPPLTYTAGKPTSVPCGYIVGIKKGKFVEPQGLKLSCMAAS